MFFRSGGQSVFASGWGSGIVEELRECLPHHDQLLPESPARATTEQMKSQNGPPVKRQSGIGFP